MIQRTLAALFVLTIASAMYLERDFEFSNGTIDVGIVVSDIDAAVKFYGAEGIGLSPQQPFSVGADFCRKAGLTTEHGLDIKVFRPRADTPGKHTAIKLMQSPAETKRSDNRTILSQYGLSYLTIYVTRIDPIMDRLAAMGVEALAEGPTPLPGQDETGPHLVLVQDPDGNMIELIGPR